MKNSASSYWNIILVCCPFIHLCYTLLLLGSPLRKSTYNNNASHSLSFWKWSYFVKLFYTFCLRKYTHTHSGFMKGFKVIFEERGNRNVNKLQSLFCVCVCVRFKDTFEIELSLFKSNFNANTLYGKKDVFKTTLITPAKY